MSTFSSANITDGNLLLKERTHRIKITYSMHQYYINITYPFAYFSKWQLANEMNVIQGESSRITRLRNQHCILYFSYLSTHAVALKNKALTFFQLKLLELVARVLGTTLIAAAFSQCTPLPVNGLASCLLTKRCMADCVSRILGKFSRRSTRWRVI